MGLRTRDEKCAAPPPSGAVEIAVRCRYAPLFRLLLAPAAALCLVACTPHFDWREVRGTDASWIVLMPAKPAAWTRDVNFDGPKVAMTMTAVDIDGAIFAVGTATLPDDAAATNALHAMRTALVRNIAGTIKSERANTAGSVSTLDLDAAGAGAPPVQLHAHLVARDRRIYQVVAIGPETSLPPEAVDTFLTSFKLK